MFHLRKAGSYWQGQWPRVAVRFCTVVCDGWLFVCLLLLLFFFSLISKFALFSFFYLPPNDTVPLAYFTTVFFQWHFELNFPISKYRLAIHNWLPKGLWEVPIWFWEKERIKWSNRFYFSLTWNTKKFLKFLKTLNRLILCFCLFLKLPVTHSVLQEGETWCCSCCVPTFSLRIAPTTMQPLLQ